MLPKKIINHHSENKLKNEGNVLNARKKIHENNNLNFLLKKRYGFINKHLNINESALEIGSGAGHSKYYLNNKNIKTSDMSDFDFLDFKNIDCLNMPFENESFENIISLNVIHHVPNPIRLFNEVGRILKKNGKFIIIDVNLSFFLKLMIILTKSEKYDENVDIYNKDKNFTDINDIFDSNNFIPSKIFQDFSRFNSELNYTFSLTELKYQEFLLFLNSGGVILDAPYVPLNKFFLKTLNNIDNFLCKFKTIFPLLLYACLKKE